MAVRQVPHTWLSSKSVYDGGTVRPSSRKRYVEARSKIFTKSSRGSLLIPRRCRGFIAVDMSVLARGGIVAGSSNTTHASGTAGISR